MLSDKSLRFLSRAVHLCSTFKTIPYEWDDVHGTIKICKSKRSRIICPSMSLYTLGVLTHLVIQFVFHVKHVQSSAFQKSVTLLFLSIWIIYYSWSFISYCNAHLMMYRSVRVFQGIRIVDTGNQGILGRVHPAKVMGPWGWMELYTFSICSSMWGFATFATILFILVPQNPEYLVSFLLSNCNYQNNSYTFVATLAFEVFSKFGTVMIYIIDGINMFTTVTVVRFWTQRFGCTREIPVVKKIGEYQKLSLLIKHYNSSMLWMQLPNICGTLLFLSLFCLFGSIRLRLHGHVQFVQIIPFVMISSICLTFLLIILYTAATVYSTSKVFLQILRSSRLTHQSLQSQVITRQMQSLKPYGIQIGLIQRVKKISVFYTVSFVSNSLASLLVSFPG